MAIPLLDALDIAGKDITAEALLTQRKLADDLVVRQAHDHFTVKGNQPTLLQDIAPFFQERQAADLVELTHPTMDAARPGKSGLPTPSTVTWISPHVGQTFAIEREVIHKKSGNRSREIVYGITSRPPAQADARRLLHINRGHWSIENSGHYLLDWNYDEDRCRIQAGYGPENISRLRRFAIGIIQSKGVGRVAQKLRQLNRNTRLVFDYLRMTKNSCTAHPS
jgi:predicted transposase YbfD/YdcC